MNYNCAVLGCCNALLLSTPIDKWYPFPDQNSLTSSERDGKTVYYSKRRLWVNSLGLNDKHLATNAVICPLHFKEQDFIVSEDGHLTLKDDAVPHRTSNNDTNQLEVSPSEEHKTNENVIETEEKCDDEDDDDDVQIIEPHREIITLDDDEDECQKATSPTESNLSNSDISKDVAKSVPEADTEKNDKDSASKEQEKDSNVPLTCMSPEAITHSIKDIINEQTSSGKAEVVPPSNKTDVDLKKNGEVESMNTGQNPTVAKSIVKEPENLRCLTIKGDKYLVQVPKPGSSKLVPAVQGKALETPVLKFVNIPDMSKMKTTENNKVQVKGTSGQNISTMKASESLQRQLSVLLNDKRLALSTIKKMNSPSGKGVKLQVLKDPSQQSRMYKTLNIPILTPPPQNNPLIMANKGITLAKGITSPIQNGIIVQAANETEVYKMLQSLKFKNQEQISEENDKKTQAAKTQNNQANQSGSFKYVNVNEIIKNQNVKKEVVDEKYVLQATREIGTQTDDELVGFTDMYNYIKKHMIDFTFESFGQKYVLKECSLHFVTPGKDKKVAIVSESTLSSTDSFLLSAMHISIGKFSGYTKKVEMKSERITKLSDAKKTENSNNQLLSSLTLNSARKIIENKDFTIMEKDKKIIISPNLVNLRCKLKDKVETTMLKSSTNSILIPKNSKNADETSKMSDEELNRNKKIIKKKKGVLKTLSGRPRKTSRVPVSQMNPTFSGRLNVDRKRFKKNKKSTNESEKKRRLPERIESEEHTEEESKASTSTERDLLCESKVQGDSCEDASPVKTRSITRGRKKDYRRLSTNGTTEEDVKKTPTKRRRPLARAVKAKKTKYSDKVGAIESFLEVVLEPENSELDQSISDPERGDNEDNSINPKLESLVEN